MTPLYTRRAQYQLRARANYYQFLTPSNIYKTAVELESDIRTIVPRESKEEYGRTEGRRAVSATQRVSTGIHKSGVHATPHSDSGDPVHATPHSDSGDPEHTTSTPRSPTDLETLLFDNSLIRLWRTGAEFEVYSSNEDADPDVSWH